MSDPQKYLVSDGRDERDIRRFTRNLIQDMRALEHMLENEMFETGVRRIGAEQELFLVDDRYHPAPAIERVLEGTDDAHLVTELTRFNIEFNTDPIEYGGNCLRQMEEDLERHYRQVRVLAERVGVGVVLTGILP